MTRAAIVWISIGLWGAVLGGALGTSLHRLLSGGGERRASRGPTVSIAFVLLGAAPCAIAGWFLGAWLGGVATRGCQEMDCLSGLLWPIGGDFLGAIIGGAAGAITARRVRRASISG